MLDTIIILNMCFIRLHDSGVARGMHANAGLTMHSGVRKKINRFSPVERQQILLYMGVILHAIRHDPDVIADWCKTMTVGPRWALDGPHRILDRASILKFQFGHNRFLVSSCALYKQLSYWCASWSILQSLENGEFLPLVGYFLCRLLRVLDIFLYYAWSKKSQKSACHIKMW